MSVSLNTPIRIYKNHLKEGNKRIGEPFYPLLAFYYFKYTIYFDYYKKNHWDDIIYNFQEKNTFEGDTIEDILAQFEKESTNRAVACPNCKVKFFANGCIITFYDSPG